MAATASNRPHGGEQGWQVQRLLYGPYEDELKRRVYLCEARKADWHKNDTLVEEEWQEIEERHVHVCSIRAFHRGSDKISLRPRPPKRQRDGTGPSRGVGTYTSHDKILERVRYVSTGEGTAGDFYEENARHEGAYCDVEVANIKCTLTGWDEILHSGTVLELRTGGYVFAHKIQYSATDGEVDTNSIVFQGVKLVSVASIVKCDGSDGERELGEACVVSTTEQISAGMQDVVSPVPTIPAVFWEDGDVFDGKAQWIGHVVGNQVQSDGNVHIVPLSQSPMARYGWASLSFTTQAEYYSAIHASFLKKFDAWLRRRVTTQARVVSETILWFPHVPAAWLYWVLGRAWFEQHGGKARYNPDLRMHEFAGPTADFQRVFRRDIGRRINYSAEISASVGAVGEHPAVTFRYSMLKPGKLMLQLGNLRKHINSRVTWDTARNPKLIRDTFNRCPCCWIEGSGSEGESEGESDDDPVP